MFEVQRRFSFLCLLQLRDYSAIISSIPVIVAMYTCMTSLTLLSETGDLLHNTGQQCN